ncbi:MAG: hypothetical protein ABI640_21925 [Gammaproteobacteria bacterium]
MSRLTQERLAIVFAQLRKGRSLRGACDEAGISVARLRHERLGNPIASDIVG